MALILFKNSGNQMAQLTPQPILYAMTFPRPGSLHFLNDDHLSKIYVLLYIDMYQKL